MLVPVVVDDAAKEWSLLEFQGDLLAADGAETQLRALDVGTLRFRDAGEITLRIGNHVLSGRKETLRTGFAILQKHVERADADGDAEMKEETQENATRTRYEVVGVAKTRVVFKTRPKPVLG